MTLNSSTTLDVPILEEIPHHSEVHPVNYIQYLGDAMKQYRLSLGRPESGAQTFCDNVLAKYVGGPVNRGRLSRLEKGCHKVEFGLIAAFFNEMKIWPEIIQAAQSGKAPTMRYMLLVHNELRPELRDAHKIAKQKIEERNKREKSRL